MKTREARSSDLKSSKEAPDRRAFLRATGAIVATAITGRLSVPAIAQERRSRSTVIGRRKLGPLEVSARDRA